MTNELEKYHERSSEQEREGVNELPSCSKSLPHPSVGKRATRTIVEEKPLLQRATKMMQDYVPLMGRVRCLSHLASSPFLPRDAPPMYSPSRPTTCKSSMRANKNGSPSITIHTTNGGDRGFHGNGGGLKGGSASYQTTSSEKPTTTTTSVIWTKHETIWLDSRSYTHPMYMHTPKHSGGQGKEQGSSTTSTITQHHFLLLGTTNDIQVWDTTYDDHIQLVGARDVACAVATILAHPNDCKMSHPTNTKYDIYADHRPLIAWVPLYKHEHVATSSTTLPRRGEGTWVKGDSRQIPSVLIGEKGEEEEEEEDNEHAPPTHTVYFGSLYTASVAHHITYPGTITSVLSSARHVVVATTDTIYVYMAMDLSKVFTVHNYHSTHLLSLDGTRSCSQPGVPPIALGSRFLAYAGPGEKTATTSYQLGNASSVTDLLSSPLVNRNEAMNAVRDLASGLLVLGDQSLQSLSSYFYSSSAPSWLTSSSSSPLSLSSSPKERGAQTRAHSKTSSPLDPFLGSTSKAVSTRVIIFDLVTQYVVATLCPYKSSGIGSLAFDPTGTLLFSSSMTGRDFYIFQLSAPHYQLDDPLLGPWISPDGRGGGTTFGSSGSAPSYRSLATGHDPLSHPDPHNRRGDGTLGGFNYVKGRKGGIYARPLYRLNRGLTNAVVANVSFSADSRWVSVATTHGTVHVFALHPTGGPVTYYTHCSPTPPNVYTRIFASAGAEGLVGAQQTGMEIETITAMARVRHTIAPSPPFTPPKSRGEYPTLSSNVTLTGVLSSPISVRFGEYDGYQEGLDGECGPLYLWMYVADQSGRCTQYRLTPTMIHHEEVGSRANWRERYKLAVRCTGESEWDLMSSVLGNGNAYPWVRPNGTSSNGTLTNYSTHAERGFYGRSKADHVTSRSPLTEGAIGDDSGQEERQGYEMNHKDWQSRIEISTHDDYPPLWMGTQFVFKTLTETETALGPGSGEGARATPTTSDPIENTYIPSQDIQDNDKNSSCNYQGLSSHRIITGASKPVAVPRVGEHDRWSGNGNGIPDSLTVSPANCLVNPEFLRDLTTALDENFGDCDDFRPMGHRHKDILFSEFDSSGDINDLNMNMIEDSDREGEGHGNMDNMPIRSKGDNTDIPFLTPIEILPALPRCGSFVDSKLYAGGLAKDAPLDDMHARSPGNNNVNRNTGEGEGSFVEEDFENLVPETLLYTSS